MRLLAVLFTLALSTFVKGDPCSVIAGKKWAAPKDVRACFTSFKVNSTIKDNKIEVINKTLAFHTSVSYEVKAPEPFTPFVHENLLADLARIQNQSYASDYDLHIDLSRTLKRLNDGHCVYTDACYDSLFVNYLPTPLVLLTDDKGNQTIHIAPEAFKVASVEFSDEIQVWQDALPASLKGKLESLSGAQVLLINDHDPWDAVNANALITGSFQGLGTRQNSFFSSYQLGTTGWNYVMGNFAQQSLPLNDSVTLSLRLSNTTTPVQVTLPYRSRFSTTSVNFTNSASFRANNCQAVSGTNGVDLYASANGPLSSGTTGVNKALQKFQQKPPTPASSSQQRQLLDVMLDTAPLSDILLPSSLQPVSTPVGGSFPAGAFFLQSDNKTGVFALGSFSGTDLQTMQTGMLQGLLNLQAIGATQLIVDVSNNGGGLICAAHFLHRIIIGPKNTTVPQAGLFTEARDGPLAQLIVKQIVETNADPDDLLIYNPLQWRAFNGSQFSADDDWLVPPVKKVINGRQDAFSQELGQECQPNEFLVTPPNGPLFEASKVVIVSNGRCASSCALFSVTMAKEEGVKTVVIGGKEDVEQEYCGTVGGQSTDFSTIDSEVKTTHLKNNSLAPPDFLVNAVQGITWRLALGVNDPTQPEEWQDHPATLNLPLTPALVNNPDAIWTEVTARLLS